MTTQVRGSGSFLTVSDWFCGAGGSSSGAVQAGLEVSDAANHWRLAGETHATNHPKTRHYIGDLMEATPKYFPKSNILWASPECRKHKPTSGRTRKNDSQLTLWTSEPPKDEDVRSRANAWVVVDFAETLGYEVIVVENIIEFRAYWHDWDKWLTAMHNLGYRHKTLYHNSMFFHPLNGTTHFVPQSRDRLYVVFWKKNHPKPNLDFRPWANCPVCETDIQAVQSWKRPDKKWGVYGKRGQYWYRCPKCAEIVEPYYYAAANIIDWSLPGQKIGDRERPLADATMARIRAGIEKYGGESFQMRVCYSHASHKGQVRGLDDRLFTITARNELAFLVSSRGGLNNALAITDAIPSITTTNAPWLVRYRKGQDSASIQDALGTISAGGVHHGLVMPVISTYNGNSTLRGAAEPAPTISTVNGLALHSSDIDIEECRFRMFEPHENKRGMGFLDDYILLGTKKEKTKLAGNAVPPPNAEWILGRVKKTF